MNFHLLFIAFLTVKLRLGLTEKINSEKKVAGEVLGELIVSPDSKNDTIHIKEEVDNIREAINGDGKLPIATLLQLHDTSDVRSKIKDAVGHGKYAKGTPVPGDINVRLNANKEEGLLNVLAVGDVPSEEDSGDDCGKLGKAIEIVDTSMKKDLSNPKDSGSDQLLKPSLRPVLPDVWTKHRFQFKEIHERPIFLRETTINTVPQFPFWFNLRRDFLRGLFGSKKN